MFSKELYPNNWVRTWLLTGVLLVFVQVILGGITRLTGSGLSITEWEIVTGTFPPLNAAAWEAEFALYKQTPQYEKINDGISMSRFKFIYFWEYFHRLWARSIGFIFLIPFFVFLVRKKFTKRLFRRLINMFLLGIGVASMGWIMVASGLVNRPWVNAYKLSFHLGLALILYGYILWTYLSTKQVYSQVIHSPVLKKWMFSITGLIGFQIFVGGIMAGMKAGLFFPTWPDMNGQMIPDELLTSSAWNVENLVHYDQNAFAPALIQMIHRVTAYILCILILFVFARNYKQIQNPLLKKGMILLTVMLIVQIILGIITVINCKGSIPLFWGVVHQGGGVILLTCSLFVNYLLYTKRET